uniref:RNase H type-1 domain-containing protein n=1 Tax=Cannabis sativa TaxID=3483 RepID=A0A803QCN7_CANSA
MLGKQAWRLISNEGSIVSRVYKARYYPQESFFSASLGCNPSFIWKSLFETKDLIKAGTIIHIGNGLHTSITSDPWLPDLNNPKVTSAHPALFGQKVTSLMCVGETSWDSEILNDMFDDRDKALILGIPLSQASREDCWSWLLEKSGIYSVKSAYRVLQQSKNNGQQNSALWKDFWKIEVPSKGLHFGWKAITGCLPTKVQLQIKHVPVDNLCPFCNVAAETIIHILVYCPYANSCWIRSSISISTDTFVSFSSWFEAQVAGKNGSLLKEILMIAWAIWNARNKLVWDKKSMLAADVVLSARSTLNQWSFAHQRRMDPLLMFNEHNVEVEHWITPANDTIKAASVGKIGRVAPEVAEVAGIKEALSWIKSKDWHKVSLESDCLVAVQAIHSSASLPSAFGQLVADCQQLLAALNNVKVYFVKHSANKAAHFHARSSCYPSVRVFYDYNSPAELVEIVKNDSYL